MDPGYALLFGIHCLLQPDVSLGDLRAFPPPQVARRMLAANVHARELITARAAIDFVNPTWWWEAHCEAGTANNAWDALCSAQDEFWSEDGRLRNLRRLREMLGWEAYYGGRLPPPVPLWAFPRTDSIPWHLPPDRREWLQEVIKKLFQVGVK